MDKDKSTGDFIKIQRIYFLGIGGIGMSALARYFKKQGKEIFGYDKTETPLTKKLVEEGLQIHYEDDVKSIPRDIELVVFTPAIPRDSNLFLEFRKMGMAMKKRSEVLGILSRQHRTIAIAGTHGKTTTASYLTYLMDTSGLRPLAFVGGIMKDYNSNVILGDGEWMIAEADEYDRSFLFLEPEIALITALDPDHLDIYGSAQAMIAAYRKFCGRIQSGGLLWIQYDAAGYLDLDWRKELESRDVKVYTYGLENGDFHADNLDADSGRFAFTIRDLAKGVVSGHSPMPGKHNLTNMLGAMAIGKKLGLDLEEMINLLSRFGGIDRRMETVYETNHQMVISDYAHHPEEIKSAIDTIRDGYRGRKLTVIFQPHLYSRTRDFYREFARVLERADESILTEIYPAREIPIQGVTSGIIRDEMLLEKTWVVNKSDLCDFLGQREIDILLILGAGDIDRLIDEIIQTVRHD